MLRRADDFRSRPEDVLAALLEVSRGKLPRATFDKTLMEWLRSASIRPLYFTSSPSIY